MSGKWYLLPAEVCAGCKEPRPIYLFVRPRDAERFTYVGQLAPANPYGSVSGGKDFGAFELAPILPSRVWELLGGLSPGQMDASALDQSLQRIDRAQSVHERLEILRQFSEFWHGPIDSRESFTDDELRGKPIPFPLRWWYQLAGHHENIMSGQNKLLNPSELNVEEGELLFYVENQGVYLWSTNPEGEDPPVKGKFNEPDYPWIDEGMLLSEFMIGACMFEAIMRAPFAASAAWAEEATLTKICNELAPLPLAPWRWPSYPSRFFARNGAFMFACPNDDNQGNKAFSIWIGAKTEHPLAFLQTIVDKDTWERVAL
ncbi:MAG: hypothetical protein K8T89_03880 [Planctomycetes bacterium]|nr:hypothetical protein [Planctomycetota bacterium]